MALVHPQEAQVNKGGRGVKRSEEVAFCPLTFPAVAAMVYAQVEGDSLQCWVFITHLPPIDRREASLAGPSTPENFRKLRSRDLEAGPRDR